MRISARAILISDERILVIKRKKPNGHAYLAFPGGGVEQEETLEQCVVREIFEETGLTVAPQTRFAVLKSASSE